METEFDQKKVTEQLNKMSSQKHRFAFAISVCERLYPNYIYFSRHHNWGNPNVFRMCLDAAWEVLSGKEKPIQMEEWLTECEENIPDTEDFDSIFVSSALDASTSIVALLRDTDSIATDVVVEIASFARDTVDMYVQELESMEFYGAELEEKILKHPLMQAELKSQRETIESILAIKEFDLEKISYLESIWKQPKTSNIGFS